MVLAIDSYANVSTLVDGTELLNLAWTLDERSLLSVDVPALISAELAAEISAGLRHVNSYPVQDPYAEGALADAVAAFFGLAGGPPRTPCGAGVGPLLHGLA